MSDCHGVMSCSVPPPLFVLLLPPLLPLPLPLPLRLLTPASLIGVGIDWSFFLFLFLKKGATEELSATSESNQR